MVVTLGQQYNVGEKPTVIVISHIQRTVLVANSEKQLNTAANPARGLLNRKRTKILSLAYGGF